MTTPSFSCQVATGDGLHLPLSRLSGGADRPPVLLLHGASTDITTFLIPHGRSIGAFLQARGYDVWLLDWRSSQRVASTYGPLMPEIFTLDGAATHDIPAAVEHIHRIRAGEGGGGPVHVVAHCMGATTLAMALGDREGGPVRDQLGAVVLTTVGLFFDNAWQNGLKVQDRLLERVAAEGSRPPYIHPAADEHPWPASLEGAFALWPRAWMAGCRDAYCARLSFMYGAPFLESNLADGIHHNLRTYFGGIAFGIYRHAAQNALRGFVAPCDADGGDEDSGRYFDPAGFKGRRVTLLTGDQNALWHRRSIDHMYEWLLRCQPRGRFARHVIPGYGHQDLFWGRRAWDDVFPVIEATLAAA